MSEEQGAAIDPDEVEQNPISSYLGIKSNIARVQMLYEAMLAEGRYGKEFEKFTALLLENQELKKSMISLMAGNELEYGFNLDALKVLVDYDPQMLSKINEMSKSEGFDAAVKSVSENDAIVQYFVKLPEHQDLDKITGLINAFHARSRPDVKPDFFVKLAEFVDGRGGIISSAIEQMIGMAHETENEQNNM